MKLIETKTVTSAQPNIAFSAIPQNFTDLCFVVSGRTDQADNIGYSTFYVNSSTSNWTVKYLQGNSSTNTASSTTSVPDFFMSGGNTTSNTFGNGTIYIPNYTAAVNKSMSIDFVNENNASVAFSAMQRIVSALWSNSSAITSAQFVANSGSNFVAGTTISLYGIGGAGDAGVKATGGIISYASGYVIHTFTASGTFTPTANIDNVEYLVVAGGGGGAALSGGGGGAGGYRSSVTGESSGGGASAEAKLSLTSGTAYTVTVGAGGAGAPTDVNRGSSGFNSVFATITSTAGGGGGYDENAARLPLSGGSGGGAGFDLGRAGGAGTTNQGFAGGNNAASSVAPNYAGAGGGGAGSVGANATASVGGNGGSGLTSSITGSAIGRAGGGGGGFGTTGTTATSGGGAGGGVFSGPTAVSGTVNTGGGGGGGRTAGGTGGSGIVIVRYAA